MRAKVLWKGVCLLKWRCEFLLWSSLSVHESIKVFHLTTTFCLPPRPVSWRQNLGYLSNQVFDHSLALANEISPKEFVWRKQTKSNLCICVLFMVSFSNRNRSMWTVDFVVFSAPPASSCLWPTFCCKLELKFTELNHDCPVWEEQKLCVVLFLWCMSLLRAVSNLRFTRQRLVSTATTGISNRTSKALIFFSPTGATVAIAVCVIILVVLLVVGITIFFKRKNSGVRYQAANFNAPPHAWEIDELSAEQTGYRSSKTWQLVQHEHLEPGMQEILCLPQMFNFPML